MEKYNELVKSVGELSSENVKSDGSLVGSMFRFTQIESSDA